jgi:hypothetical protein
VFNTSLLVNLTEYKCIIKAGMESELRELIGKYGLMAVHKAIDKEMLDTFNYLSGIYGNQKIEKVEKKPIKKNIIVEDVVESFEEDIPEENVDPSVKQVVIDTVKKEPVEKKISVEKQKMYNEVKAIKESQKEAVAKKRKELEEKGITLESLLTKENFQKWIGEGCTYSKIARDYVGCTDSEIARAAKAFGLQSNMSKHFAYKRRIVNQ